MCKYLSELCPVTLVPIYKYFYHDIAKFALMKAIN